MNEYVKSKQSEFLKSIDFFKKEIANIRTGRANPGVLEGVMVEAYGTKTPVNGVATINVPDAQSITVAPWDKNIAKNIEKAIIDANLGLGVVNEGDKIRLTVPKMTEDTRRELVKKLNEKQEEVRIRIRNLRDEIKVRIEKAEKDKEIAEDDKFRFLKELDEEVHEQNEKIKEIRDLKEKDIMTI